MKARKNRYRPDWQKRKRTLVSWLKELFFALFSVAGVVGLSALLVHSYYALLGTDWLAVEEIQVSGLNHVEHREALDAMGVCRRANVLGLKMHQLSRRLEDLPWVRSAVVRLDMPGRLVVEITEREPLAIIYADGFHLVDREGLVFAQANVKDYPHLLLVTDLSDYGLKENDSLPPEIFEPLKDLLSALEKVHQWLPVSYISECHWKQEEGFVLYTIRKAIPIRLGMDDFQEKLSRLYRVFGVLTERRWWESVTRIDLDYSKRVYLEGDFPAPKGI